MQALSLEATHRDEATTGRSRPGPLVAFLLALVVLLPATFPRDLWAPDEPRHAEIGRSMLETGDYLVPHLNGEVYSDKPAFPFWLVAASMRLTGSRDPWAARLPFALAAAGTIALTLAICQMLGAAAAAPLAALFLLTGGRYLWLSQRVSLDVLSTFFSTLAILAWLRQQRGLGRDLANGLLFFGSAGLGVLGKGPLGVLVPLFVALFHGWSTGTLRRFTRPAFLAGIPLFLAVLAAWIVPACLEAGSAYSEDLLVTQGAGRVFNAWNHENPPWYYLPKVALEFLPWSPLLIAGLWLLARGRHGVERGAGRLLLAWFWPTFVFLSIVEAKRGNYLTPLYPGMAILAAVTATHLSRSEGGRRGLRWIVGGVAGLLGVAGAGALVAPLVPRVRDLDLEGAATAGAALGIVLLALAATIVVRLRRGGGLHGLTVAAGCVAVLVPVAAWLAYPIVDQRKSERPVADELARLAAPDTELVPFLDVRAEGYRFYSGLDCREVEDEEAFLAALSRPDVDLAVAERDEIEDLGKRLPATFEAVYERRVSRKDRVVILRRRAEGGE